MELSVTVIPLSFRLLQRVKSRAASLQCENIKDMNRVAAIDITDLDETKRSAIILVGPQGKGPGRPLRKRNQAGGSDDSYRLGNFGRAARNARIRRGRLRIVRVRQHRPGDG